ncbi:exopolysaccharide biosynthesis protein [uncultured Tateyamaria sp.]|uniref:exopolysaccharide biosynthesis protein n=1 Tax=Tateyamaria sp. 1078 TaxID=3417464 RepID=UPI0026192DD6|nr:exopolysaccharide biosynthesis protein [uncultured Tateyamaria sp.]
MSDAKLTLLLDRLEDAGDGDTVSVQDILDATGDRSIMPVVLAIALILVSPLSGIPGLPTLSAIVVLLVMGQAVFRRQHLWLPGFLCNRQISRDRFAGAIRWMRRPAAWIDRHSHPRLRVLTVGPLRWLTLLVCMCVPLVWPFLELLPFVTSFGAGALALMTFGLFTRDGLYVLWGYSVVGCMAGAIAWLVQAGT